MATEKLKTIDQYFKTLQKNVNGILRTVRKTLKQNLPKQAEEIISFGIPSFKWNRTPFYYAGWKEHISVYPIPKGDAAFQKEIQPFVAGKGTLKFMLNEPLPFDLIAKIAKTCVAIDSISYKPVKPTVEKSSAKVETRSAKTK